MALPIRTAIKDIVFPLLEKQFEGKNKIAVPHIVSPPGCGKTQIVEQYAKERGWGLLNICFPTIPLEELTGMPRGKEATFKVNGSEIHTWTTEWSIPEIITRTYDLLEKHDKCILFLDDNHLSDEYHQAILFALLTDGRIKMHTLHDRVCILSAGNKTMKAGARKMMSPIIARLAEIEVYPDIKEWMQWAMQTGIHPVITSFISYQPEHLLGEESNVEPWPCPREWAYLAVAFDTLFGENLAKVDEDLLFEITKGHVGKRAASDFVTFVKLVQEIDINAIVTGKVRANVDSLKDAWIVGIAGVMWLFRTKPNKKTLNMFYNNIFIPVAEKHAEVAIMILASCAMRSNSTLKTLLGYMGNSHSELLKEIADLKLM